MSADLSCKLRPGEVYEVSFYVSCSDRSKYAIDRLGLHFTDVPIKQENDGYINLGRPPHIENTPAQIVQDKDSWIKISGTYIASGTERYLTIGNFYPDGETSVFTFSDQTTRYGSYYVDLVEVTPEIPWLDLGPDTILCSGDVLPVYIDIPCATNYLWNDGIEGNSRIIDTKGTYSVSVDIGCGKVFDEIIVDYYPDPNLNLPDDTIICSGTFIELLPAGTYQSYLWHDGSNSSFFTVYAPGIVWVEVEELNGCYYRDSVTINALSPPTVELGPDTTICLGDSIVLYAGDEDPYNQFLWNTQNYSKAIITGEAGYYSVVITNPCGEATGDKRIITRDCEVKLWVPSAFSPDSDGLNDFFHAHGVNVDNFRIYIFNRLGQLIFEGEDLEASWDGRFNGEPCPEDVYTWMITYHGFSDETTKTDIKKGMVMLIRNK